MNTTLRVFTLVLLCSTLNKPVFAQNSTNPFELTPRMDPALLQTEGDSVAIGTGNPFDIVAPTDGTRRPRATTQRKREPLSSENAYQRFIFIVVIGILALLTLLITAFRSFVQKSYSAFITDTMMNQVYRDRESVGPIPYWSLYSLFFINAGLFIFFLLRFYNVNLPGGYFLQWIYCTVGVFGLFLLKHLLLNITGSIFPVAKETRLYNFLIMIFGIVNGLFLTPVNILLAYGPKEYFIGVIYFALIVLVLIYVFRYLRGLFIGTQFLLFHRFHFLLYICSVEIAPVMILVKLLQNQI